MKKIIIVIILSLICISIVYATTKVYFSPEDRCDEVIIEYIKQAKNTVDIAIFSLTRDEIAETIIETHKRGVKIRVIIDKQQAGLKNADDEKLEDAGIPLIRDTHSGFMHNKFAVIDKKIVLTGSYNWTDNATFRNDENLVVLDDVGKIYSDKFEQLWSDMKRESKINDGVDTGNGR